MANYSCKKSLKNPIILRSTV